MGYWYLTIAIVAEVLATSALKESQGFSRLIPSLLVVVGYGASFYFLSLVLQTIPIGVAYALWAGLGIVLISIVGVVIFGQKMDLPGILGIALIISGVAVLRELEPDVNVTISGVPFPFPPDLDDGPIRAHVGDYPSVSVEDGIRITHQAFKQLMSEGRLGEPL